MRAKGTPSSQSSAWRVEPIPPQLGSYAESAKFPNGAKFATADA